MTRDALEATKGEAPVGDARTVELKGIEGAVEVPPVLWRWQARR